MIKKLLIDYDITHIPMIKVAFFYGLYLRIIVIRTHNYRDLYL